MEGPDPVGKSVAALSAFFVGSSTLAETLDCVVGLATDAVAAARHVGITMVVDDRATTSSFSDPEVPQIDQAQYESGRGPCLDAFRTGKSFSIPCTRLDRRWPEFSRAALDHGINSTFSIPLVAGPGPVGALNLYAEAEDGFSDEDKRTAETFAVHAAAVLANARAYWDAVSLSENLTEAMRSRATIEQAKGILIAQSHVDADTAFDLLRKASQRENRKVREMAEELVRRASQEH